MRIPSCVTCAGACCETMLLPATLQPDPEWAAARGLRRVQVLAYWGAEEAIEVPCRCPKLDGYGLCSIYGYRPKLCVTYEVGGPACRSAITRRRTPEQMEVIFAAGEELP